MDGRDLLISRIYEAAAVPELWPDVLVDVADYAGAFAGVIFTSDLDSFRYATTPSFSETFSRYIDEGWFYRTDRTTRLLARKHAGFVTDFDIYTQAEFAAEPLFRELLGPSGIETGAATVVDVPSGDRLVIDVERAVGKGPFPAEAVARLDGLRPHLCRAALLTSRLRLRTVRAATEAFSLIGLPAVALDRRGRALAMNDECTRLLGLTLRDGSRLSLVNATSDALLRTGLDEIGLDGDASPIRSIPVPAASDQPPGVLHLVPVRRAAGDIFAMASAIAILTPLAHTAPPGVGILAGLFDLTAAEARVARHIASGDAVADIATHYGLSTATIRTQLKAVMAKTATSRQADLVRLLAGTTVLDKSS